MAHVWDAVLTDLESKVHTDTFDFWLKDIAFHDRDGDAVRLAVDDTFFKAWIEENYLDLIEDAFADVTGETWEIELVVDEASEGKDDSPSEGRETNDDQQDVHAVELDGERVAARETRLPDPDTSAFEETESELESEPSSADALELGLDDAPDPEQKSLEAGLSLEYTFERFAVGESKQFVRAACEAVADHPATSYNPLFLYGDVGLGKTHLLQAIGNRALRDDPSRRVMFLSGEDFTNRVIAAIQNGVMDAFRAEFRDGCDLLLVDDVQVIAGKEATQKEFFHTFNALYNNDTQIVLTSDEAPAEIAELDEKLASRFGWGLCEELPAPGVEARMAIIEQKADDEGLELDEHVVRCMARHVEGNVRELESAFVRLSARAELMERPVTIETAREVLEQMNLDRGPDLEVDSIIEQVASYFDIEPSDIRGSRRTHAISKPRQYAMYLARTHTDHSYPRLGELFGGKDHTTVLSAYEKIDERIDEDTELAALIRNLEGELFG